MNRRRQSYLAVAVASKREHATSTRRHRNALNRKIERETNEQKHVSHGRLINVDKHSKNRIKVTESTGVVQSTTRPAAPRAPLANTRTTRSSAAVVIVDAVVVVDDANPTAPCCSDCVPRKRVYEGNTRFDLDRIIFTDASHSATRATPLNGRIVDVDVDDESNVAASLSLLLSFTLLLVLLLLLISTSLPSIIEPPVLVLLLLFDTALLLLVSALLLAIDE